MATFDEIATFVRQHTGTCRKLTEATSLQADICVVGDDLFEFMDAFAAQFKVDLSGFLWYFHTAEEGWNPGGLLYPPPSEHVRQIPITLKDLKESAERGIWFIHYPDHDPPTNRPDLRVNVGIVLCLIVVLVLCRCFS